MRKKFFLAAFLVRLRKIAVDYCDDGSSTGESLRNFIERGRVSLRNFIERGCEKFFARNIDEQ